MKLLLPPDIAHRLARLLKRSGSVEVGGVLMGEHVDGDIFRIVDFSSQSTNNTSSSFLRMPSKHNDTLDAFFKKTGLDYSKYNYLGEWHSHPRFAVHPSDVDIATMMNMLGNNSTSPNFAILLIIRLARNHTIEIGAWLFVPNSNNVFPTEICLDDEPDEFPKAANKSAIFSYGRRFLAICGFSSEKPALQLISVTNKSATHDRDGPG